MTRLGLCCVFKEAPIRFRGTTARYLGGRSEKDRSKHLGAICRGNAIALAAALAYCRDHGIGAFRVNSRILPLKTHPVFGYHMAYLPGGEATVEKLASCGAFCREHDIRTSFHPDQFVLLSALDPSIVENSVRELAYQAAVAQWIGADVITIHGGGAYGDKTDSLRRLRRMVKRLPDDVRSRLALENDDRIYTPSDLLPVCRDLGIPLVYDAHHHRCLKDTLSVEEATEAALTTWNREPLFHLSSPAGGWAAPNPRPHHDYIDPDDFPNCWKGLDLTVEMEAKAKELAILKFKKDMAGRLAFR